MSFKIDLLMPSTSQYEVLHHFTIKLFEAFVRQGNDCRLLSGDDRIYATLNSPPDFTLGFNGALKLEDETLFCDYIKVPHVACLVDPSFRFLELTKSPYTIITCDDRIGCALLKKQRFNRSLFMPHAVEQELSPDLSTKRLYDVTFLATCIDADKRRQQWEAQFDPEVCLIMEKAADRVLAENNASFISILSKSLDPREHQQAFQEVEMYLKGMDRLKLLQAFPDQDVHIFGDSVDLASWDSILKRQSNVIIHPSVSYRQGLEIMKKSKVVLNSSIKNTFGAHERIFAAAACGAVVVTNDNPLMRQYFEVGKEILLYNRKNSANVNQKVKKLLDNEGKRIHMADGARAKVMQNHTWDHRVKFLLEEITPILKRIKHDKTPLTEKEQMKKRIF